MTNQLGSLSLPLQAAGPHSRAPHLRAIPASLRLESVVCFARYWRQHPFVLYTEERLLDNTPAVLSLFARNPFPDAPPRQVRAVVWQYWFTDWPEKRQGLCGGANSAACMRHNSNWGPVAGSGSLRCPSLAQCPAMNSQVQKHDV